MNSETGLRATTPGALLPLLTGDALPNGEMRHAMADFARLYGWHPSDHLDPAPGTHELANGHLLVEHGLSNTAVVSFLRNHRWFEGLPSDDALRLLAISYNNLVDWQIFPNLDGLTCVFNRADPPKILRISVNETGSPWHSDGFRRISRKAPHATIRALDASLIETVSFWKRAIAAAIPDVENEQIAHLFNLLILFRAREDQQRWAGRISVTAQVLADVNADGAATLSSILAAAATRLDLTSNDQSLLDTRPDLRLDAIPEADVKQLISDLYKSRFAPYIYDFSLISKHALSRIYEHYVSLLRSPASPQLTLFADLPQELTNRRLGAVYTPQYIARFFARFVHDNITPRAFRSLRSIDPACGSGIFLRTLLEMRYADAGALPESDSVHDLSNVVGVDVDPSACEAARLSLALLHLAVFRRFPSTLNIINSEALKLIQADDRLRKSFDAVLANPPFVRWESLGETMRAELRAFLGDDVVGKPDLFLGILKAGLELVKPFGFVLFVLPYSFLTAENALKLRERIGREFWVRYLVDLSEAQVFEGIGSYITLVILQRKPEVAEATEQECVVIRARDSIGSALQDGLAGKSTTTASYEVFTLPQRNFAKDTWAVLPRDQAALLGKLDILPSVADFLDVYQGLITGADTVFVRPAKDVLKEDRAIWPVFLRDRDMQKYTVPEDTGSRVFVPFRGSERLTRESLQTDFPATWAYLQKHRSSLSDRTAVERGNIDWWSPERPRRPDLMLRPKIVGPELMAFPRFGLDGKGRYAVSHSSFLLDRHRRDDAQLLQYFVAVLNSPVAFWQMSRLSTKYDRGYSKILPRGIRGIRVPNPTSVPVPIRSRLNRLVQRRLGTRTTSEKALRTLDHEIELVVADAYALTDDERVLIGL